MQTLYIGEDNLLQIGTTEKPLRRASNGATITNATITAQLKSEDLSSSVGSQVSVSHVAGGVYQGTLPSTLPITQDARYFLEVTIGGSVAGSRRIKCQAQYHVEEP